MDESIALLREGYTFASTRRARTGDRAFRTRLQGRSALVVGGTAGAELFYDTTRVVRHHAVPGPVARTLFGRGAVHGLDGPEHQDRKSMFLGLLTPAAVEAVVAGAAARWDDATSTWPGRADVDLQVEAAVVLGGAILQWAGVETSSHQVVARSRDLVAVVEGFGSVGPARARAFAARWRTERWCREAIAAHRRGRTAPVGSAVQHVADHRDRSGEQLDERTAAVELHNLIRPTVAVSWFVAYAAMALDADPDLRSELASGHEPALEAFAHELRRAYPFVPVLAARAARDLEWHGHHLAEGDLVVLDVWGTHHDPADWDAPERVRLERFLGREPGPFELLAQGGGDARTGHRCPGERLTIELVKDAAARLARTSWELEPGDHVLPTRMPPTRMPPSLRGRVVLQVPDA